MINVEKNAKEYERMKEDNSYKIERKMDKIYEKLLDIEDRLEHERLNKKEKDVKHEKSKLEDELFEIQMQNIFSYDKRKDKMNYYNDRY